MFSEIIINVHPFEKRVAILEDHKLVELFVEKKQQENIVGNIYKGIIKDILPGMGAAFVDIGLERTAFLHFSDIAAQYLQGFHNKKQNNRGNGNENIANYLKEGQEIIVQIQKGPIGKKGARLTGQISIPGKFLVYFPNKKKVALSRKISSNTERSRIKSIVNKVKHDNVGLIIRTDADGNSEEEFKAEYDGLHKTWKYIEKQIKYEVAPSCLYSEGNLFSTLIRDLFSTNIDRLIVDDKLFKSQVVSSLRAAAPELVNKIELYSEDSPIFDAYGIEKEIKNMFNSRCNLPSGGNIVIEQTEALCAIDINTGSFTGSRNYQETVRKTNVEAAAEAARQIRLRNLSGIMVIDFIDMLDEKNKNEVLETLRAILKRDRAKNKVFPFGPLGLVHVTRKRTRQNLLVSYSEHCPCCKGTGRVMARDSVAMQIYRWLSRSEYFIRNTPLRIVVHPNVKKFLDENPTYFIDIPNDIFIVSEEDFKPDQYKIFNNRNNKEITAKFST